MLSLREVVNELSGARLTAGAPESRFQAVSTDSRRISKGDLFIAIKGELFDGHGYVAQAQKSGACACLVSDKVELDFPTITVPDTRIALGELARMWRRRFPIPVIGVVGSNGKTTTKEMIASILRASFGEDGFLATQGNLNNDIGVPMTLLRLKTRHGAAVIEMGMNHPKETAWLAAITEPTICVVTNAHREHQEFMESVDAVAKEHALAISALSADGIAVLPASDAYVALWREAAGSRQIIDYIAIASKSREAAPEAMPNVAVTALAYVAPFDTVTHLTYGDHTVTAHLQTAGLHNVHNAAAAGAAAFAASIDPLAIATGLEHFAPVAGRMQRRVNLKGGLLIDDTYNANPDSVIAAIGVLADSPSPRLLVLGDMGETGSEGVAFHEEIGDAVAKSGADLFALGPLTAHAVRNTPHGRHFADLASLLAAAHEWLELHRDNCPSVLVKGSRFMQMERISRALIRPDDRSINEESH